MGVALVFGGQRNIPEAEVESSRVENNKLLTLRPSQEWRKNVLFDS